jgi:hypothetical protein
MATEKEESRGTVQARWDLWDELSYPRDGWAIPRHLKVDWQLGEIQAHVQVEVTEGRARARSVTVSTEAPRGVGWRALGKVPIRDIVATGVLEALRKVEPWADGALELPMMTDQGPRLPVRPGPEDMDTVQEIVQAAVGYNPKTKGFEVVSGDAA